MNSTSNANQSGSPLFCLLGAVGVVILFLTVLIIAGNLVVIFVFHCAPLLHHHTTSHFIQTMAYADLLVGVSCLVPSLSLLHYPPGYHGDIFQWCADSWTTSPGFSTFIVGLLYAPAALTVCFTYGSIFRICRQHTREITQRHARFSTHLEGEKGERGERCEGPQRYKRRHGAVPHHQRLLRAVDAVHPLLPAGERRLYHHKVASFLTTWLAISNSFCNCLIYSLSNSVFRKGLGRLFSPLVPSCLGCTDAKKTPAPPSQRSDPRCQV
uniref:G protein-coupled receptor 21 n=1 Tax=Labrus bergylta TaxID=56723 RepID=A0A3Q3EST8_9LABR